MFNSGVTEDMNEAFKHCPDIPGAELDRWEKETGQDQSTYPIEPEEYWKEICHICKKPHNEEGEWWCSGNHNISFDPEQHWQGVFNDLNE